MKKVNLRLTDEEHSLLEARALEGRRSLQRQIVFELFHPSPAVVAVSRELPEPWDPPAPPLPQGARPPAPVAIGDVTAAVAAARNVTALSKDCRNSDYHWKLQAGEECRFCGGTA